MEERDHHPHRLRRGHLVWRHSDWTYAYLLRTYDLVIAPRSLVGCLGCIIRHGKSDRQHRFTSRRIPLRRHQRWLFVDGHELLVHGDLCTVHAQEDQSDQLQGNLNASYCVCSHV